MRTNPSSSANPDAFCPADLELDDQRKEYITSATIVGAALASFASVVPESIGYQRTLTWVVSLLYLLGTSLCMVANLGTLIFGRFVSGLAVGLANLVAPVLLAESAEPALRGRLSSLHQLGITIGILSSGLVGFGMVQNVEHGWRWLFFCGMLPPLLLLLFGTWIVPDSPRWLLRRRGREAARALLAGLRSPTYDVDAELASMEEEVAREAEDARRRDAPGWKAVLCSARFARPVRLGVALMVIQTLSGINTVVFYSSTIFGFAGVSNPLLATVLVFGLNVLTTIVGNYLIDRTGRRFLILLGYSIMVGALLTLGLCLLLLDDHASAQGALAIVGVLLYIAGFAVGPGVVLFVLLGELVPTAIRSKAFGTFMAANWTCALLLSLLTLTTIEGLGGGPSDAEKKHGAAIMYLIFGGICVLGLLVISAFVPETKGRSLEEVQSLLASTDARDDEDEREGHKSLRSAAQTDQTDRGLLLEPQV